MRLVSLKYSEFLGGDQEWNLESLIFGNKNLIVGRNSTGKSRALNVLGSLARQIAEPLPLNRSSNYVAEWRNGNDVYVYEASTDTSSVVAEKLTINGKVYMSRGVGGIGSIYFEKVAGGTDIVFQTPPSELAITKRRDSEQHGFIEPLYRWAASVRHYHFGSQLGKEVIAIFNPNGPKVDDRDENQVIGIFRNGVREFGDDFVNAIISDMVFVGFDVEAVSLGMPITYIFEGLPSEPSSILVKEKGVESFIDQFSMSQGMYRVLALLVHVNYLQLKGTSTCVLVDDIGEGLDYERSCAIISVLRDKAEASSLQVIMSTNDRFVMNEVPLKEWTVLKRSGHNVSVRNYSNAAEQFDDFRFTGLSNFSFFEMDFLEKGLGEE